MAERKRPAAEHGPDRERRPGLGDPGDRQQLVEQQPLIPAEVGHGGLDQEVVGPGDEVAGDDGGDRQQRLLDPRRAPQFLAAVAVSGLLLITLYGFRVVSPAALVAIPTTLFLAVYLGSLVSAVRVLRGPARWAAVPASAAVAVMLACCGWALALPALVAVAVTGCRVGWRRLG